MLDSSSKCGAAKYGDVAAANFAQIETRLQAVEAVAPTQKITDLEDTAMREYVDLAAAVTAMGSDDHSLLIPRGVTATVTTDLTIPSNIRLCIMPGGRINVATGKVLTHQGSIQDTHDRIFTGNGSVILSKECPLVRVEWFGAVADGTTDDYAALAAAIAAAPNGGTVEFMAGRHKTTAVLALPTKKPLRLKGQPTYSSEWTGTRIEGSGNHGLLDTVTNLVERVTIEDIGFVGHASNTQSVVSVYAYITFARCQFSGCSSNSNAACKVVGWTNSFHDCTFSGPGNGLLITDDANNNAWDIGVFSSVTLVGAAGILVTGGRHNSLRGPTFEGNTGTAALIIRKTWGFNVLNGNWENNTIDVKFEANTPQYDYGELVDGTLINPDIVGITFENCSWLSLGTGPHFLFGGGVPNILKITDSIFAFKAVTFSVDGSEPGEGFVYRDNLNRDQQISDGSYNLFDVTQLTNAVKRNWDVEADSYKIGDSGYGRTVSGWPRPGSSQNIIISPPPSGWTPTLTGIGAAFEAASSPAWFGHKVLRIFKALSSDVAKGTIALPFPYTDNQLSPGWWTYACWVRRSTAHGQLTMTLTDGTVTETMSELPTDIDRWYRTGFAFFHNGMTQIITLTLETTDPACSNDVIFVGGMRLYMGIDERNCICQPVNDPV